MDASPLNLFPAARHVDAFDPAGAATGKVAVATDPALPTQGYELLADANGIRLTAADDAGRRYGEQAAAQLQRDDGSLPHVHLRDWPDFPVRAYLLDVSRDRVPTRATLARLVEVLATCRYNQLQLYIEHTFAHPGHEAAWRDASPITAEDLEWLDDRCADAGIELVANQNSFGHFGPWLRHEAYRARAECPDGFDLLSGVHFPPSVLAPTEANARFALELVRNQVAHVRSRSVNIGCDETFELGRGASKAEAARVGAAAVYVEHLRRLVDPLVADGLAVLFWGDVVERHPDQLHRLPDHGLTALVWNYEAPAAPLLDVPENLKAVLDEIGIDLNGDTSFATRLAPFQQAGVPFWVAPGTSTWNSLVGRLDNALGNLADAAEAGAAAGAGGFLVTDWGDNGHHHPPAVSFAPIAYGGAVAWCHAANRTLDVAGAVNRHLVQDQTGHTGAALAAIGGVATRTGVVARNASPLAAALFPGQFLFTQGRPDADLVRAVIATLEQAENDLAAARPASSDADLVRKELAVATRLARFAAITLGERAGAPATDPAERHRELLALVDDHRHAWLARSRPGGLEASAAHFAPTLARLNGAS